MVWVWDERRPDTIRVCVAEQLKTVAVTADWCGKNANGCILPQEAAEMLQRCSVRQPMGAEAAAGRLTDLDSIARKAEALATG